MVNIYINNEFLQRIRSNARTQNTVCIEGQLRTYRQVKIPNISYLNQYIDTEIPNGSGDHAIAPDTIKIMFSFDIDSTDKTGSIINNVDRVLVKEKVLMLWLKETDINNSDIYGTYKDLY